MLLFFIALILIVWWLQNRYKKNSLRGVVYRFDLPRVLLAPGEDFELVTALTNTTRSFVPYVKIRERLPAGIEMREEDTVFEGGSYSTEPHYVFKTYLLPNGRWTRRLRVAIPKRGRYTFNRAWLWGGDFLGIDEDSQIITRNAEVVVYPNPAEGVTLNKVMGGLLGDVSVRRFIIEDPVLTVGYREYTGREPLKDISWLQSARTGVVMVKKHDFTTEPSVSVVLNAEGAAEAVEEAFSIGHAVCRQLEIKKIKYDFYANFATLGAEYGTWKHLPEGLGTQHFYKVLEGLGRATHSTFESFEALLGRALTRQSGATKGLIIITPGTEAEARLCLRGRDEGRAVVFSAAMAPREA